jgi:hypothetical protein
VRLDGKRTGHLSRLRKHNTLRQKVFSASFSMEPVERFSNGSLFGEEAA